MAVGNIVRVKFDDPMPGINQQRQLHNGFNFIPLDQHSVAIVKEYSFVVLAKRCNLLNDILVAYR